MWIVESHNLKRMTIESLLHLLVTASVSCEGWLLTEHSVVGRTQALGLDTLVLEFHP